MMILKKKVKILKREAPSTSCSAFVKAAAFLEKKEKKCLLRTFTNLFNFEILKKRKFHTEVTFRHQHP